MTIYHLSHIDLDGYGAQFVAREFYAELGYETRFFNANYGKEVSVRLEQIFSQIAASSELESHILISDLNLTLDECAKLGAAVLSLKLNGRAVSFELLDHHKSGAECAAKYPWYVLDTTRCASKIVFDTLAARYPECAAVREQEALVSMINDIDIWQEGGKYFEFGKVALRMIAEARELTRFMFDNADRELKFALIAATGQFLGASDGHIQLDNALLGLKKCALGGSLNSDTIDNLIAAHQVRLLSQMSERCAVYAGGFKGFLSYNIGGTSVIGNAFLKANPNFEFFIDVNARGNVSLRANNACDVSELARLFFGGGGHPNASGGRIAGFSESFVYEDIRESIQAIFDA